jgi:hypothetical protein
MITVALAQTPYVNIRKKLKGEMMVLTRLLFILELIHQGLTALMQVLAKFHFHLNPRRVHSKPDF